MRKQRRTLRKLAEANLEIFIGKMLILLAKKFDCGYSLEAHRRGEYPQSPVCFGSKIGKKVYTLYTPVLPYDIKVGFKGIYFSWTCFLDDCINSERAAHYIFYHSMAFFPQNLSLRLRTCKRSIPNFCSVYMHYTPKFAKGQ